MGQRIDEKELRRRAIACIRDEVEAFGSGAPDSFLIQRQGLVASVTPSTPQRSLFNSVFYEEPPTLMREIDSLAQTYDSHEIRAWTVWVPDEDRETARLLTAYEEDEAIACVATIEVGDDCCVTGVATPPEHQGYERLGFADFGFIEMWELRR
jgi:hypothetical protein